MGRRITPFVFTLSLSVVLTGSSRAPTEECSWCNNHIWFDEHNHGSTQYLVDNAEGHVGGWYPYSCTEEHAACGPDDLEQLLHYAVQLDLLGARSHYTTDEVASLLREAQEKGVTSERVQVGIRLAFSCAATKTQLTLDIPIDVPMSFALPQELNFTGE